MPLDGVTKRECFREFFVFVCTHFTKVEMTFPLQPSRPFWDHPAVTLEFVVLVAWDLEGKGQAWLGFSPVLLMS